MIDLKLVDLFSGAGGLSLGFKQAGFKPSFAADFDPYACATYSANLGSHIRQMDLSVMQPSEVVSLIRTHVGDVDVVAGGPPCQGWSIQRRGAASDIRNDLTVRFAAIATGILPKAIVMENVPTLFGKRGQHHLQVVERMLEETGYNYTKRVVDAASFGVPQSRRRAVLVAIRGDVSEHFLFPEPTHEPANFRTVRQAIGDLPSPPHDGSEHPRFRNHRLVLVSKSNLERLSYVPEGGGRLDVPKALQLRCHRNDNGHRHLDVYGRLWWDRPAGTITAMFDNFTRGRFAHPAENRNITAREGARLQSFPDEFVFVGPKKDVARQIGNAVAPAMAKAIGKALAETLRDAERLPQVRQGQLAIRQQPSRRNAYGVQTTA
ncbi:DNA cytosine methyltransferase [Mesorhizobium atlanticum]|uniref:Cytosine-specific methyltransferase n=1 Tax=Mesorhizobium atlanticum TaxID=2233532 RepID=A0A330H094_9HYPH|nr:DNA cytosine methyltransferase [Mesorhizobium atlanticum]RAZ78248.1 DNA cytosine methyltransferase [Mesorhizobium atlanticum]